MGKTLGIDLGTTNSVVAVAEVREGKGFFRVTQVPGVTVICDRLGRRFTPSVLWEDETSRMVVGDAAKARAGSQPGPLMFSKRWMGLDHAFPLGRGRTLQPEDVAAEVLRYLKAMAEEQLGEPITDAVITVPAYFDMLAKQKTADAGRKAGLTVKQLVLEPVAAAMMYFASEPRRDLRIMTYDLGGGTFDVAIIERRDGVIGGDSIVKSDGDRFLGGYNFDRKLVEWMVARLCESGYALALNLEDPQDRITQAKLMIIAERVKIRLSQEPVCVVHEPATGIVDHRGEPVGIELEIPREAFEALVHDDIAESVRIARRALMAAGGDVDEIVMVGGSSRIPMVSRLLEEAFGRRPLLVEPDLCVGMGAAIVAGATPTFGRLRLRELPRGTERASFSVSGQVEPGPSPDDLAGCRITLNSADGATTRSNTTGSEGGFSFLQVPLPPGVVTEFTLTGTTAGGATLGTCRFSVEQGSGRGGSDSIPDVLVKAVGVMMRDGLHEVFPVGTKLPCKADVLAARGDTGRVIRIPILEERVDLGAILMADIPDALPVGSEIRIALSIGSSKQAFQVRGEAFVPALGRREDVVVEILKPRPRSAAELKRDFKALESRAREALDAVSPADRFAKAGMIAELNLLMDATGRMVNEADSDCARIQHAINEGENLVRALGTGWKPAPTQVEFEAQADLTAERMAAYVKKNPASRGDGLEAELAALRDEGAKAYAAQNQAAWEQAFRKVVDLYDRVESMAESLRKKTDEGGEPAPPPPGQALLQYSDLLQQLRIAAKAAGRLAALEPRLKAAADALRAIRADAPDFWGELRDWACRHLEPLRDALLHDGAVDGLPEWQQRLGS